MPEGAVMEAVAQIENGRTLNELEGYFKKYSDLPREVVLKHDLLRDGHWFTDAALELTSDALVKSYRLFSYDLMPMKDMKRKEHRKIAEWFMMRGGQYGLRPVTVQTTLNSNSPYVIDAIDGKAKLFLHGKEICEVSFPRPLKYYTRKFDDGTAYHEIIAYGYFVTAFRNCQYWGPDEECRFCDININARQMKESKDFTFNPPVKPVDYMVEVARSIEQDATDEVGFTPLIDYLITGGTITKTLHGKDEDAFYSEYASALKWGGHRRHVYLQTNAKDKEALKRYRAAASTATMPTWKCGTASCSNGSIPVRTAGSAGTTGRKAWSTPWTFSAKPTSGQILSAASRWQDPMASITCGTRSNRLAPDSIL
jgi:hypothetical protein